MAGAVGDEADQRAARHERRVGQQPVDLAADGLDDLQVCAAAIGADVVHPARRAAVEHSADGAAVVFHVNPIAHLQPVAVERQCLAGGRSQDHARDKLLGQLVGAVVVR